MPDTTARPAYTGPRTRFTRPDGTYRMTWYLPSALLPEGDRETPHLAHASQRVAAALGVDGVRGLRGIGATLGAHFPRFSTLPTYSVAMVDATVPAGSDAEAEATFLGVLDTVGAVGGSCRYLQPTEYGARSDSSTEVVRIEAPDTLP